MSDMLLYTSLVSPRQDQLLLYILAFRTKKMSLPEQSCLFKMSYLYPVTGKPCKREGSHVYERACM